jgi:hypothetical protein
MVRALVATIGTILLMIIVLLISLNGCTLAQAPLCVSSWPTPTVGEAPAEGQLQRVRAPATPTAPSPNTSGILTTTAP